MRHSVPLRELLLLHDSGVWVSEEDNNEGISILRSTNFTKEGSIDFSNLAIKAVSSKDRAEKLLFPGDILLEKSGGGPKQPVGRVCLFNGDARPHVFGNFIARLRANSQVCESEYLFYFLLNLYRTSITFNYQKQTTGIRNLEFKRYLSIKVPLPPLTEQRRIVDILNHATGIRRLRQQALEKTRALVPTLFIDIFGDPESNPKQWPIVPLGDLIIGGPQNGLYKHVSAYGEGTPILRIDAFYDGIVTKLHSLRRLRLSSDEIDRYGLKENNIVINRVNSPEYLGKSAIIPALSEPTVFESNMMRFSLDLKHILPRYLIQYLQTAYIKQQILSNSKHAINQSSINQQDVKSMPVPVPPLDQQESFAARIVEVQSLITQQERHLAQAEALLQSLMARFFNGTETGNTSRSAFALPVDNCDLPLAAEETEKYLK